MLRSRLSGVILLCIERSDSSILCSDSSILCSDILVLRLDKLVLVLKHLSEMLVLLLKHLSEMLVLLLKAIFKATNSRILLGEEHTEDLHTCEKEELVS